MTFRATKTKLDGEKAFAVRTRTKSNFVARGSLKRATGDTKKEEIDEITP